jgi:hypothetical protein
LPPLLRSAAKHSPKYLAQGFRHGTPLSLNSSKHPSRNFVKMWRGRQQYEFVVSSNQVSFLLIVAAMVAAAADAWAHRSNNLNR